MNANYIDECPKALVRDILTKREIAKVQKEERGGRKCLVALESDEGSFAGYFPLNAGLPDGLKARHDGKKLDFMPIVTGG
ncbi:MAG: hypothetical protein GWN01_05465 [Nitrosopumilaceae archaeon]|nr:hypothetical protein [Nitrosopumilaceae archaeon]NIU86793.1 hypothetical protein [Nitrosopumilaceae archaeon]NIX60993.1 hypothetical protein [Nitrosopumilaceae archaeon]